MSWEQIGLVVLIALSLYLWVSASESRRSIEDLRRRVRALESQSKEHATLIELLKQAGKTSQKEEAQITASPPLQTKPAKPLAPKPPKLERPSVSANPKPMDRVIVTRTTAQNGTARDTWVSERSWTKRELEQLLGLYRAGSSVAQMAITLNVDSKDIACAIARNVFYCQGELEDLDAAENNGKNWTTVQRNRVAALIRQGKSVSTIASQYGRTQLAIVWQAIDNRFTPPK